jgi:hypothetical protein
MNSDYEVRVPAPREEPVVTGLSEDDLRTLVCGGLTTTGFDGRRRVDWRPVGATPREARRYLLGPRATDPD